MNATECRKRAIEKQRAGDLQGAIDYYSQAIEIESIDKFADLKKSDCFLILVKELNLEPTTDNPIDLHYDYESLAYLKDRLNDTEGAIQCFLKAIEFDPTGFESYMCLIDFYLEKKEYAKALEYIDKIYIGDKFWRFLEEDLLKQGFSKEDWNELKKCKMNNEKQNSNP